jgi:hypothetical protein
MLAWRLRIRLRGIGPRTRRTSSGHQNGMEKQNA